MYANLSKWFPEQCRFWWRNIQTCAHALNQELKKWLAVNSSPPGQNGSHFADDIFKRIFLNENVRISNQISLKFVPIGPIDNSSALVKVMAWRQTGDKPLHEPMLTQVIDAYMRHYGEMSKATDISPCNMQSWTGKCITSYILMAMHIFTFLCGVITFSTY